MRKIRPVDVVAIIKCLSIRVEVRLGKFVLISVNSVLGLNNIRSVVDHDVKDDPDATIFCIRDQALKIFL